MISLENVSLKFEEEKGIVHILNDISITFEPGKLYVITGPNGGGKTSVAKVMMGIHNPSSGKIILDDQDITSCSISERAFKGVRYAFQNPPRFKGIDVKWFLKLANEAITEADISLILKKIGLCPEEYLERTVDAGLSGGEMKRMEIASVLLSKAKVAILDEPEAGVDLWGFEQLLNLIIQSHHKAIKRTTIIISHSEKFLKAADEIIVVANGKIQVRGNYAEIHPLIQEGINCRWRKVCLEEEKEDEIKCGR